MNKPSTIYLENCLSHCNIANSIAYLFEGSLNISLFNQSVQEVLSRVQKFQYELIPLSNTESEWREHARRVPPVKVIDTDNFEKSFGEFTAGIFNYRREYDYFPLFFTIFRDYVNTEPAGENTGSSKESEIIEGSFHIVETLNHTYCDGRSCEFLFNEIIACYNALLENDSKTVEKIKTMVSAVSTPASDDIYAFGNKESLIKMKKWQHIKNIFKLATAKLNDRGAFSVKYDVIEKEWENFRKLKHYPEMHRFDLTPLIEFYEANNKQISNNSLITALLVKAFYYVNSVIHNNPENRIITFRMMSDILSARQRQQFIGNYCAYVPVITDGSRSLEEICLDINRQVENFRKMKADVSMYKFLEYALRKGLAGKKDDPTSFTVSLVLHRKLIKHPEYLKGCHFIETTGGLNYEPLDLFGAKMNNKVGPTLALSNNNILFITYYPLIGGNQILDKVTIAFNRILKDEIAGITGKQAGVSDNINGKTA